MLHGQVCRARIHRITQVSGRKQQRIRADRDQLPAEDEPEDRPDELNPEHWISDAQVGCASTQPIAPPYRTVLRVCSARSCR